MTYAIHETGDWAVRFLLVSLLITPLRFSGGFPKLILIRRMVGVTALAYAVAHLLLFAADKGWSLWTVGSEIALRLYLTIGFAALTGLAVLGATSTDAMIRKLGSVRWSRLHGAVYGLTALALLHFFLQSRLDISQPVLMAGLFLWLMGWRWLKKRSRLGLPTLVALAAASAAGAALVEAAWYGVRNGFDPLRILAANLAVDVAVRPALWVGLAGVIMALLHLLRAPRQDRRRMRASQAEPAISLAPVPAKGFEQ